MNTDEFWQIIDSVHRSSDGNMDRKCELLKDRLSDLGQQDLRDFIGHYDAIDMAAYTWPLWGAAYVMHGGCSDDAFSDFRATLISQGRRTYEQALVDPESLVDLVIADDEDICYEGFQYVKNDVAEEKLGAIPQKDSAFPDAPSGDEWDEEALPSLYPRLSAKYSFQNDVQPTPNSTRPWWKFW